MHSKIMTGVRKKSGAGKEDGKENPPIEVRNTHVQGQGNARGGQQLLTGFRS